MTVARPDLRQVKQLVDAAEETAVRAEQLACYSEGMTTKMKRNFKFVNVHGNAYYDVTSTCVHSEYASAA